MRLEQRRASLVHLEGDAEPRRDDLPSEDLVDRLGLRPRRLTGGIKQILRGNEGLAVVVAEPQVESGTSDLVGVVSEDPHRPQPSALR